VISKTAAVATVEAYLQTKYPARGICFIVTRVDERPSSWVVYYDSEAHLKSQSVLDHLAGNRPLLVSKTIGTVAVVATPAPTEDGIAAAEAKLVLAENIP
jgi:Immunity protein 35